MTTEIRIENTKGLNKKEWKKYTNSIEYRKLVQKLQSENPNAIIVKCAYKEKSEAQMKAFDKMVADFENETPLTPEQIEAMESHSRRSQLPSSMR